MDDNFLTYQALRGYDTFGVARLADNFTARRLDGTQAYSLVRAEGGGTGAWRVSMGRLTAGVKPPVVTGVPPANAFLTFEQASYAYAAAFIPGGTEFPARRTNPIFGRANYATPAGFGRVFVELAWGLNMVSANRMVCDWPMLGGSVVLYGDYVEARALVFIANAASMSDDDMPFGSAMITKHPGMISADGNEMSFCQQTTLLDTYGAVLTVPDFARRVMVTLAQDLTLPNPAHPPFTGSEAVVPPTGDRPLTFVWLDDQGRTIFTEYQRTSEPIVVGTPANAPVAWRPVPAGATCLALRANDPQSAQPSTVMAHWRLAP